MRHRQPLRQRLVGLGPPLQPGEQAYPLRLQRQQSLPRLARPLSSPRSGQLTLQGSLEQAQRPRPILGVPQHRQQARNQALVVGWWIDDRFLPGQRGDLVQGRVGLGIPPQLPQNLATHIQ